MTALAITITPEGIAAAVNAANTGTGPLVITQVALLSAPSTEIKRITTLGGDAIADNIIHVTITDETADTYALTGLRLITDGGIIFATYHQASPIVEKGAQQLVLLSADIVLTSVPPGSVTIGGTGFQYPPATTTRQGVIEIATDAEVQTGTDTTRAVTPAGLQATAATTAPAMNAAAAVGTAKRWARADHVHPSDTSKANTTGTYAELNVGYASSAGNAATVGGWNADPLRTWGNLIGRPSTIAGYGITDALVYNNGGTYGINVTGSSAYATNAGYANTAGTADTSSKLAASPGTAPHYAVRAWVNYDGTTNGIRSAGNVTSITDLGVGKHRINFAAAMPTASYVVAGSFKAANSDVLSNNMASVSPYNYGAWSVDVVANDAGTARDCVNSNIHIIC